MGQTENKPFSCNWHRCLALLLLAFFFINPAYASKTQAAESPVHIHIFWSQSCPHCKGTLRFIQRLEATEQNLNVQHYEISKNRKNMELLLHTAKAFNISDAALPFVLIGSQVFIGYNSDTTTGDAYRQAIEQCRETGCPDGLNPNAVQQGQPGQTANRSIKSIHLPVIGDVSLGKLSLPVLTIALGAADGFNPCALWVLVFLLGLLTSVKSRARRWLLGSTFVITSALVYYLIMVAWLNALMLLGFAIWVRLGIGIVAIGVGGWSLREFFVNPEIVCKVSQSPARRAVLEKLREIALSPSLLFSIAGIIFLAAAVNAVELLCSAGIPATFTQILALNNLPPWQYHTYLGLYILVFMLDDLLLFFGAMLALEVTGLGTRFARWANLIGGIIMLTLGLMMIFKPEWLV